MHRIYLQVIIATFTPVKFTALYGCFDKPTVLGKFSLKATRTTFLKTSAPGIFLDVTF
jgi:hypothetical protein